MYDRTEQHVSQLLIPGVDGNQRQNMKTSRMLAARLLFVSLFLFEQLSTVSCSFWYVNTLAGSANGFQDAEGTNSMFRGPSGLCVGVFQNVDTLFVSDGNNHRSVPHAVHLAIECESCFVKLTPLVIGRIRTINLENGMVSTVAGSGAFFGGYVDGPGATAQFNAPGGLTLSSLQNKVFIADSLNHRIRFFDLNTTTVGTAAGAPDNILGTFVGGYLDGPATLARFNTPKSVAMSRDSNTLFIADTNNHMIRAFNLETGTVSTLAGVGFAGSEDGDATSAQFSSPAGVAVSPDSTTVFVADSWNHRIRTISILTGEVETLSGAAQFGGGFRDGTPTMAMFRQPAALLAMNGGDSVVVGDTGNGRVRMINVNDGGTTETLAGAEVNRAKEGLGTDAWFASPSGMVASPVSVC